MGKTNTSVLNLRKDSRDLLTAPVDLLNKTLEGSVDTDFNVDDITSYAQEKYKLAQIGRDDNVPNVVQDGNKAAILAGYAQQMGITPEQARQDPMAYEAMKKAYNEGVGTEGEMLGISRDEMFPGQDAKFAEDIPMSEDAELEAANRRSAINDLGTTTRQEWTDSYKSDLNVEQAAAMHSSIDRFLELGDRTQRVVSNLAVRMKGRNADRFNAVTIANDINSNNDLKLDPKTVGEYVNGFVHSYSQIEEQGLGRTFTDVMLAAKLKESMENEWVNTKRRENPSDDFLENADNTEEGFSSGMDAKVGRMMHQALGIKSTPQMDVIGGAIARKTVVDSHSELFETKMVDTGNGKMAQVSTLRADKVGAIEGMQDLIDTMMPTTLREVRRSPKVDKSTYTSPKKNDKSKNYGDFTFVNKTVDVLDNTGHSMAYSLRDPLTTGNVLEVLLASGAEALTGKNWMALRFDPATGLELESNIDKNGNERKYIANTVKRKAFAREIAFAKANSGMKMYWDHNLGSNNRFYMSSFGFEGATAGNFHSSKIARSMLEAMAPETYSLGKGSADLIQLKAGIMLKFGSKIVDKRRGVHKTSKELAVEFDNTAAEWTNMLATPELVAGNANKIAEISGEHEGAMSVSAMVEGVRLLRAIKAGDTKYTSKFYTEIDGIANGVAHNALQSGANGPKGGRILSATGLFTDKALKEMSDGTFNAEDVYEITVTAALGSLRNGNAKPEDQAIRDTILEAFIGRDGETILNRSFGKKPMMIFGYGAGDARIKEEVAAWVDDALSNPANSHISEFLKIAGVSIDDAKRELGLGVVEGVKTDFGVVKNLNEVMQGLAEAAINSDVAPTYTTREGHIINLGQWYNQVDTSVEGVPVKYSGKHKDWGLNVKAYPRKKGVEPFSVTESTNAKTGEVTRKVGQKAISQAGVLTTQAQDGINIGMTMQALEKAYTSGGSRAAQIFDAMMITPKRGRFVAKQLNGDFYKMNKEWSMVEEFMRELVAKNTNVPVKLQNKVADIRRARRDLFKNLQAAGVNQFPWPK
jgi:hypothetical protein